MPVDPQKLLALDIPQRHFEFSERDTMLYALGIGFGQNPTDENELRFTFERNLKAVPTMASVIGWDRTWIPATGLNWSQVVHGEEHLNIFRPLPVAGAFTISSRVSDLVDKGKDKGAILRVETTASDRTGPIFRRTSSFFARGDGGFGKLPHIVLDSPPPPAPIPDGKPHACVECVTPPNSALLYRLSGDRNPLHSDPEVAVAAGFPRPILHGLCSYGHACRAVLQALGNYEAERITSFDARFSAPVFPGETLQISMWHTNNAVLFEALVKERNLRVLKNGQAKLR